MQEGSTRFTTDKSSIEVVSLFTEPGSENNFKSQISWLSSRKVLIYRPNTLLYDNVDLNMAYKSMMKYLNAVS